MSVGKALMSNKSQTANDLCVGSHTTSALLTVTPSVSKLLGELQKISFPNTGIPSLLMQGSFTKSHPRPFPNGDSSAISYDTLYHPESSNRANVKGDKASVYPEKIGPMSSERKRRSSQ